MNFIHNFLNLGKLWKRAVSNEYFSMKIVLLYSKIKETQEQNKNLIKYNNLIKETDSVKIMKKFT